MCVPGAGRGVHTYRDMPVKVIRQLGEIGSLLPSVDPEIKLRFPARLGCRQPLLAECAGLNKMSPTFLATCTLDP